MEEKIKTLFLVGHVTEIAGPGYHLRDFMVTLPNCKTTVVFHPMPGSGLPDSTVSTYPNYRETARYSKKNGFVSQLVRDSALTIKHLWQTSGKIDVYIGLNNFDTLPALLFKGWKIKQIIYFGSDYADHRFANVVFDALYRFVELLVLRGCDISISNTYRAMARRIELGLDTDKSLMIPNGVDLSHIPKLKKKPEFTFIYPGYLSKTHGLIETIDALKKLLPHFPKIKLAIAGFGPHEEEIREYVHGLKMDKQVQFLGNLPHLELLKFMKEKCLIGIASYTLNANWVKFGSPLKVKEFLACDMAVVMSDVTEVAEEVEHYQMGLVYRDYAGLYLAMDKLCRNPKLLQKFIDNGRKYIMDFDWKDMFEAKLKPHMAI